MVRVLVVDNDPNVLELVMLDLRLEGHFVVGAADGDSALTLVEDILPAVVVIDYRMPPGPTGLVVGKQLRAQYPDLHIVLHTNYPDASLVRDALESNILFLPKGDLRRLRLAVSA